MDLTPSARRLLRVLRDLPEADRHDITNTELAELLGTSVDHPRTVNNALHRLQEAGLIRISRSAPHPDQHRTGRVIHLTNEPPEATP